MSRGSRRCRIATRSFEGDDPDTADNEAFDPLFLGFYDWGTWWQGEIAGEYFLSNSNLKSHLVRAARRAERRRRRRAAVLQVQRSITRSRSEPAVTETDAAFEIDAYVDWKVNANFTVSLVGAYANPGKAVQQAHRPHQELRLRHGLRRLQLLRRNGEGIRLA